MGSVREWLRTSVPPLYPNAARVIPDVEDALGAYNALVPRVEQFMYNDGTEAWQLQLKGTLPVAIRGSVYNIPVNVWLPTNYPVAYPMTYVSPTATMAIKPNRHVDANGLVYHQYLTDWALNAHRVSLREWLTILQGLFAQECPVFSKVSSRPGPPPAGPPPGAAVRPLVAQSSAPGLGPGPRRPLPPQSSSPVLGGNAPPVGPPPPFPGGPGRGGPPDQCGPPPPYGLAQSMPAQPGGLQAQLAGLALHRSFNGTASPSQASLAAGQSPARARPPQPQSPGRPAGSLLDEPDDPQLILQTLRSAVRDKISRELRQFNQATTEQVDRLLQENRQLVSQEMSLSELLQQLAERENIGAAEQQRIELQLSDLAKWNERLDKEPDIDLDVALRPRTVVEGQLATLVATDHALSDTIHELGRALSKEKLSLDSYLKHIRALAGDQFRTQLHIRKAQGVLRG